MSKVNNNAVKEKCIQMNDAWFSSAKNVTFNCITQAAFEARIKDATAIDTAIAELEAKIKTKREIRNDKYAALDQSRSKVGSGVAGNANYGDDSPLYGAMGFVRKSERRYDRKNKLTE